MVKDKESLINAENKLNKFVIFNPLLSKFTIINRQGNLFEGFDTEP